MTIERRARDAQIVGDPAQRQPIDTVPLDRPDRLLEHGAAQVPVVVAIRALASDASGGCLRSRLADTFRGTSHRRLSYPRDVDTVNKGCEHHVDYDNIYGICRGGGGEEQPERVGQPSRG